MPWSASKRCVCAARARNKQAPPLMGDPVLLKTSPHAVCGFSTKVVVPPQNHTLRNATATTTGASIDVLRHSPPDRVGPTISQGRLTVG